MRTVSAELVTRKTPGTYYLAYIVSDTDVAAGQITGADVDDMPDDAILAAGSVIRTPSGMLDALKDGVFFERT